MTFSETGGKPIGIAPPSTMIVHAFNRTGGTLLPGEVVAFAMDLAEETANAQFGDELSCWANVVDPATADLATGYFGVAMDSIADDTKGRIMVQGIIKCTLAAAYGTLNALQGFSATNASHELTLVVAGVDGEKIIAKPLTIADADDIATVLFSGLDGFGNNFYTAP